MFFAHLRHDIASLNVHTGQVCEKRGAKINGNIPPNFWMLSYPSILHVGYELIGIT